MSIYPGKLAPQHRSALLKHLIDQALILIEHPALCCPYCSASLFNS
jgi:hypothetical protein